MAPTFDTHSSETLVGKQAEGGLVFLNTSPTPTITPTPTNRVVFFFFFNETERVDSVNPLVEVKMDGFTFPYLVYGTLVFGKNIIFMS